LGSPPMNLIECTYQDSETFKLSLPKDISDAVRENISNSEVVLGFRPEDVTLVDHEVPDSIKSEVYVYEPLGSEIIVDIKVGDVLTRAKVSPDTQLRIGQTNWITLNKNKMRIFDKKTGRALN